MLNKYPLWKNLLILLILGLGFLYSAPNLYPPDPAIQISSEDAAKAIDDKLLDIIDRRLDKAGIAHKPPEIDAAGRALVRLADADAQLKAQTELQQLLRDDYIVALNLAGTTPQWLLDIGAEPMKLGLDLKGGVHFLLEVDTNAALLKRLETYASDIKPILRENKARGLVKLDSKELFIDIKFKDRDTLDVANSAIREQYPRLNRKVLGKQGDHEVLRLNFSQAETKEIADNAVNQNQTTLRNRVNELGVAEPLVQRQGLNRIVVELPGVQDTAQAKRIIGKTANLEFRLEAGPEDGPGDKQQFGFKDETDRRGQAFLQRKIVVNGEQVSTAQATFDENSRPQVSITLDGQGGKLMHRATRDNVGRNLGVLFIERKTETRFVKDAEGKQQTVKRRYDVKEIISLATIQSALGTQFRITGLSTSQEASNLALLLRAGALAAPIEFVEERTVGPSLGEENIRLGIKSVVIGLALVLLIMVVVYKEFGIFANIALVMNLVLLIAVMSILSATLTLPGIAGIVLTVGMAVDANVLIFARIREELKNGLSPQMAINSGYERAFVTILDANVTTLLAAVILYAVGTGSIKGFAITLSVGIVTSMFTAILCTRALVNLRFGGRKIKKLFI